MKKVMITDGNMAEYDIYPLIDSYDSRLKSVTIPIDFGDVDHTLLAYIVLSLMKSVEWYQGLGLSANQCAVPYRICVINHIQDGKIYALINPRVVEKAETEIKYKEGCLSFPGLFLEIARPEWVEVEFQSVTGETKRMKFEGIWATCVQHEIDHLDGICYTDKVSRIKLDIAHRKVKSNLRKIRRATTGS